MYSPLISISPLTFRAAWWRWRPLCSVRCLMLWAGHKKQPEGIKKKKKGLDPTDWRWWDAHRGNWVMTVLLTSASFCSGFPSSQSISVPLSLAIQLTGVSYSGGSVQKLYSNATLKIQSCNANLSDKVCKCFRINITVEWIAVCCILQQDTFNAELVV